MTAYKGSDFLLKIGDGGAPEIFTTVGGMRTTRFVLDNQIIDCTNKDSGRWRGLLEGAGISTITITGSGIFTDSAAEEATRTNAFDNLIKNYQICFGNGNILEGMFQISSYERAGEYNGEETYSITLESASAITFTTA